MDKSGGSGELCKFFVREKPKRTHDTRSNFTRLIQRGGETGAQRIVKKSWNKDNAHGSNCVVTKIIEVRARRCHYINGLAVPV